MVKLKNKKGESYIDVVVFVLVCMMVTIIILNTIAVLDVKQKMDYFAKQMIDTATAYGSTEGKVEERYEELCREVGFSPTHSFEGTAFLNESEGTVQLGETIRVTIRYDAEIGTGGFFAIPFSMKSSYSGLSRRYHK